MRSGFRTTAKSRSREHGEAEGGVPSDLVGAASDGEVVGAAGAEDGGGGGREGREPLGDAQEMGSLIPSTRLRIEPSIGASSSDESPL